MFDRWYLPRWRLLRALTRASKDSEGSLSFMARRSRQAFFPHTIKRQSFEIWKDNNSSPHTKKKLTFGALTTPPLFFTLLLTAGRVVFVWDHALAVVLTWPIPTTTLQVVKRWALGLPWSSSLRPELMIDLVVIGLQLTKTVHQDSMMQIIIMRSDLTLYAAPRWACRQHVSYLKNPG